MVYTPSYRLLGHGDLRVPKTKYVNLLRRAGARATQAHHASSLGLAYAIALWRCQKGKQDLCC